MKDFTEQLVERIVERNEARLGPVVRAFARLMPGSWPVPPAMNELALPSAARLTPAQTCRLLLRAFDELHSTHPTVAFWWKDEDSTFLGACPRLGPLGGLPSTLELLGVPEGDERLGWARQSNLYRRDDREVLQRNQPKLNIVERQDREGGVVWLRTSKAPYKGVGVAGTVGGFDEVTEARARELARG